MVSRKMGAGDTGEEVIEVVDGLPTADRRSAFNGLKVEAILETPLNIAVTCDQAAVACDAIAFTLD